MQPKDYRKNDSTYIKYDRKGSIAGLVEVVISKLLDFVSVGGNPFSHVDYWLEQESLEVGCCSKDFCGQGLTQLSLFKLLNAETLSMLGLSEEVFTELFYKHNGEPIE